MMSDARTLRAVYFGRLLRIARRKAGRSIAARMERVTLAPAMS